ncbi:MAG: PH domain-containing protein [Sphingosinicella sp.]
MTDSADMRWQPLDPAFVHLLRLRGLVNAGVAAFAAGWLDFLILSQFGVARGLVPAALFLLLAALGIGLAPRRYRAWGYAESDDELHVRSGLWVRRRTLLPLARVQHIDIAQGPLERRFGLATLILHTAGTRGASVPLPGLSHVHAEAMRDRIRARIRRAGV